MRLDKMTFKSFALAGWLVSASVYMAPPSLAQNAMEPVVAPNNVIASETPVTQDVLGEGAAPAASALSPQHSPEAAAATERRQEQLFIALDETYRHHMQLAGPENPPVKPQEVGSLLFTVWEHMLIDEWRKGATTAAPLPNETPTTQSRSSGIRELSLAGIVYRTPQDWTVWLNGQRLKPDALPREIMDINVRKQYVELEWFDSSTNLIYPIRLRPHQRFNLDSRIFLPGTAAN